MTAAVNSGVIAHYQSELEDVFNVAEHDGPSRECGRDYAAALPGGEIPVHRPTRREGVIGGRFANCCEMPRAKRRSGRETENAAVLLCGAAAVVPPVAR